MQRVTIFAARSDAAVMLQADYYSPQDAAPVRARLPAVEQLSPPVMATMSSETPSRAATFSPYRNPIQLYLRTQGSLGNTPKAALLDVLA